MGASDPRRPFSHGPQWPCSPTGAFCIPLYVPYVLTGRWPFGRGLCKLWLVVDYLLCTSSVFNIVLISYDRFLSVTRAVSLGCRSHVRSRGRWPGVTTSEPWVLLPASLTADMLGALYGQLPSWCHVLPAGLVLGRAGGTVWTWHRMFLKEGGSLQPPLNPGQVQSPQG